MFEVDSSGRFTNSQAFLIRTNHQSIAVVRNSTRCMKATWCIRNLGVCCDGYLSTILSQIRFFTSHQCIIHSPAFIISDHWSLPTIYEPNIINHYEPQLTIIVGSWFLTPPLWPMIKPHQPSIDHRRSNLQTWKWPEVTMMKLARGRFARFARIDNWKFPVGSLYLCPYTSPDAYLCSM